MSDDDVVTHIYRNAMNGAPGVDERALLLDALTRGYWRDVMLTDFSNTGQYVVPLVAAITTGIAYLY